MKLEASIDLLGRIRKAFFRRLSLGPADPESIDTKTMPDRNCGMCGVGGPVGDALKVVTDPLEKVAETGMEYSKKGYELAKEGASKGVDLAASGVSTVSSVASKGVDVVAGPVGSAMDATVMKIPGADVVAEKTKEVGGMAMDATGKVGSMAMDGAKGVGSFAVDGAANGIKAVGEVSGTLVGGVEDTFAKLGAAAGFQSIFGADIDKSDEGLEKAFKDVDTDGSGKISEDEMKAAIEKMYGKALDEKVLKEMMAAADTNNDGEIDVRVSRTSLGHRGLLTDASPLTPDPVPRPSLPCASSTSSRSSCGTPTSPRTRPHRPCPSSTPASRPFLKLYPSRTKAHLLYPTPFNPPCAAQRRPGQEVRRPWQSACQLQRPSVDDAWPSRACGEDRMVIFQLRVRNGSSQTNFSRVWGRWHAIQRGVAIQLPFFLGRQPARTRVIRCGCAASLVTCLREESNFRSEPHRVPFSMRHAVASLERA